MLEVRVNFPLDDNEIERIFNALRLKHDTTHSMVFGKYVLTKVQKLGRTLR